MSKELIPNGFRDWVMDCANRMQVPPEFIAIPMVVTLSAVIGRKIGIRPKQKDSWTVIPIVWGYIVGRPGVMKSPAMKQALVFIEKLIEGYQRKFEKDKFESTLKKSQIESQLSAVKMELKDAAKVNNKAKIKKLTEKAFKLNERIEDIKPVKKRIMSNDGTIEKIAEILAENKNGLLIYRDELSGFLKNLDKPGRESDRAFIIEAWNGDGSFTFDRIGRGTLHLEALCLVILGGIQPSKLKKYVDDAINGGNGDDGLFQRFQLPVFPEISEKWKYVDRYPNKVAFEEVLEIYKRLDNADGEKLNANLDEHSDRYFVQFDETAQKVFEDNYKKLELRIRTSKSLTPAFESHISKYRSLIPALALIFHLIEYHEDIYDRNEVTIEALDLAIKWSEFLEAHAKKIYSHAINPEVYAAKALVDKIKAGKVQSGSSLRSIYRKHWSLLDTSKKVEGAVGFLEDLNWVQIESVKQNGLPSEVIHINPQLFDGETFKEPSAESDSSNPGTTTGTTGTHA